MWSFRRPIIPILVLAVAALVVTACGTPTAAGSWPGLVANENVVYVAYGPGVLAVDVAEQQKLWAYPEEPRPGLYFYAPPAVGDGRLIVGDFGVSKGMFSFPSGVVVSVYALDDDGQGIPATRWTAGELAKDKIVAAPLIVGDRVYVGTSDNYLLALELDSGDLVWQFEAGHSIWAQPVFADGVLYVASLDKNLYALDAESGAELWRATFEGALASQPVIGGDLIYVPSFDGQLHALALANGEERWAFPAEDWVWASPAVADGRVIFADIQGNVYAVEADSGESLWKAKITGAVQAAPVVDGNTVYVVSIGDPESERGVVIALGVADGQELWRDEAPVPLYATPVIADGSLVVALQSQEALLYVYDLETGNRVWEFSPTEGNS